MSLETLIGSITQEAQAEADRIVQRAEDEARRIREAARSDAQAETERLLKAEEDRCRKEADQGLSQARLGARNRILEVRQELVDAVFDRALQTLRAMDDDDYRDWMKRRILALYQTGDETVVVSEADHERLDAGWQDAVEQALRKQGTPHALRIEYAAEDFGGGFLLRHPAYEVDARFSAVVESIQSELRAELAAVLFQEAHAAVLDHAV